MKRKIAFFLLLLGGAGLCLSRLYAYQNWIEPAACAYRVSTPLTWIPAAALFLLLLAGCLLFIEKKDAPVPLYPGKHQVLGGIFLLIALLGDAYLGAEAVWNSVLFTSDGTSLIELGFYLAVDLLALIGLFGMAICLFSARTRCFWFFALAPLPFALLRLIGKYMSSFSAHTVVEFPWELLMLAAECLFLLFFSRRINGDCQRRVLWGDAFSAAACFLLVLSSSATKMILFFTDPSLLSEWNQPCVTDLTFGLLALFELASLAFGRRVPREEKEAALFDDFPSGSPSPQGGAFTEVASEEEDGFVIFRKDE